VEGDKWGEGRWQQQTAVALVVMLECCDKGVEEGVEVAEVVML
jgi:hypothetical protein